MCAPAVGLWGLGLCQAHRVEDKEATTQSGVDKRLKFR